MVFYIWLTIICVSLSYISTLLSRKKVSAKIINVIDFIPYLILIIITGFRYSVGTDYNGYAFNFNYLMTNDIPRIEYSFKLIVKLAHLFGLNQQFMFFVYAAITYIFIFLSIKYFDDKGKYRHIIMLLILQYFLFNGFNTVRQMVAVSIFFYSIRFIVDRNLLKYIIWIIIATFFHKSAIICLIFYFILNVSIKKLSVILIVSPIFLLTDLSDKLLDFYISLTGNNWYEIYLTNYNSDVEVSGGKIVFVLYVFALILAITSNKVKLESNEKVIVNLFIWYIIILFFTLSSAIATRVLYYPMVSLVLVFPLITKYFQGKYGALFSRYLVFIFVGVLWISSLNGYKDLFEDNKLLDYSFRIFIN
ncbi:EpsG family protein [Bacillus cytotoxicus]|uniref:EpsG family protein n=1 Tax=Bacillus cytotoxicus TaxID=580165 RepID=A0ACC6A3A4_9BACI|nr:EpsG family protein [Bacillus cytotoxicus]HDX9579062.1 EpsG family protein [Bacillus pseudomycoides]